MAKVVVTYDTESKELVMTVDGESKGDIESFHAYSEGEGDQKYGYFEAGFKTSKENGVRYRMSAHGSKIEQSDPLEDFFRSKLKVTSDKNFK
jgi:hypothetical protein